MHSDTGTCQTVQLCDSLSMNSNGTLEWNKLQIVLKQKTFSLSSYHTAARWHKSELSPYYGI